MAEINEDKHMGLIPTPGSTTRRHILGWFGLALGATFIAWRRPARAMIHPKDKNTLDIELHFEGVDAAAELDAWLNIPEGSEIGRRMAQVLARFYAASDGKQVPNAPEWAALLTEWSPAELRLVRRVMTWTDRDIPGAALALRRLPTGSAPTVEVQLSNTDPNLEDPTTTIIVFAMAVDTEEV